MSYTIELYLVPVWLHVVVSTHDWVHAVSITHDWIHAVLIQLMVGYMQF